MLNHTIDNAPRVSGKRLWSRLMAMAQIGATPHGGCNRQALTDLDFEGRELFSRWAKEAGCTVRVDAIGNLFVRRRGRDDALPVVMTGSHLDTQPTGGKFDGVYGVLAGLEVIESLNDRAISTRHPIEVAVWCNEEGCRFPAAMMGSAVWSGRMTLESAYALKDRDGLSVREELERGGVSLSACVPRQPVQAAFEVHIEQGPVLEQRAKNIGVVTGVQHMSRHEVVVEGQEAHAGPTPMDMRRDPVRVLADVLPAIYVAASERGPQARLTVGNDRDASELTEHRAGVPAILRRSAASRRCAIPLAARRSRGHRRGGGRAPWPEGRDPLRLGGSRRRVRSCLRRGGARGGRSARLQRHGNGERRRPRLRQRGIGRTDLHDLRAMRGRLEPQRSGERIAADLETGANVLLHAMLAMAEKAG